MKQNQPEAVEARSVAVVQLMGNPKAIFYATVLLALKQIWSDMNKTAWTNGKVIGIWPEFFMSITPPQRIGLMLHETLHVAFFHMFRGHEFDHDLFNMACDYVINLIIIAEGFELPPGALIDSRFKNMSVEQVARILTDEKTEVPEEYMLDLTPPEPGDTKQIEADINDILIQASIKTAELDPELKSIPPELQRHIELLVNPKIPWSRYLSKYFNAFVKSNNYWGRPNRRFAPAMYLPSKKEQAMGDLHIYVDASGSVNDDEFNRILGEAWYIMRKLKPRAIYLTPFNMKLGKTHQLKSLKSFNTLNISGKGGTSIGPVFTDIIEKKPMVTVIFTDGKFRVPKELPKTPIIWGIINNPDWDQPCGKKLDIEV